MCVCVQLESKRILRLEWCEQGVELIKRDQGGIRLCSALYFGLHSGAMETFPNVSTVVSWDMTGVHQGFLHAAILRLDRRAALQ